MRKALYAIILGLVLASGLSACGDTTNTAPAAATTGAIATVSAATIGAMPGITTAAMSPGAMPGMNMGGLDPMTENLKGLNGKDFETAFLQDMIAHHQSAVDMAALIPTHTKRPELIQLGQAITASQNKEISDMTGWLANWDNAKPLADSMAAPGMMAMMGDMDKLKNAKDADFDRQFLAMMIPHHQGAVAMSALLPSKTQRPELLQLGQDITKAQTTEIAQMQGWQKAWFNA